MVSSQKFVGYLLGLLIDLIGEWSRDAIKLGPFRIDVEAWPSFGALGCEGLAVASFEMDCLG